MSSLPSPRPHVARCSWKAGWDRPARGRRYSGYESPGEPSCREESKCQRPGPPAVKAAPHDLHRRLLITLPGCPSRAREQDLPQTARTVRTQLTGRLRRRGKARPSPHAGAGSPACTPGPQSPDFRRPHFSATGESPPPFLAREGAPGGLEGTGGVGTLGSLPGCPGHVRAEPGEQRAPTAWRDRAGQKGRGVRGPGRPTTSIPRGTSRRILGIGVKLETPGVGRRETLSFYFLNFCTHWKSFRQKPAKRQCPSASCHPFLLCPLRVPAQQHEGPRGWGQGAGGCTAGRQEKVVRSGPGGSTPWLFSGSLV